MRVSLTARKGAILSPVRLAWALVLSVGCRFGFDEAGGSNAPDAPGDSIDPSVMHKITVTRDGAGSGTVSSPAGIDCGATCELMVPEGTEVVLTATADAASWFQGWPSGPCSGRQSCTFTVLADATVASTFAPLPNTIFVSSITHDGDFNGLAGADTFCQQRATAAGLSGQFIALLSDATTNWGTRINSARGWVRPDGAPVADLPTELTSQLWFAPRLDEFGVDAHESGMWAPNQAGCNDWNANQAQQIGNSYASNRGWNLNSGGGNAACNSQLRVWCAGIDRVVETAPVAQQGRGAFTTNLPWTVSGGLAGADAACAADATAAQRTGTYRALLATTTASAISRFADGPPWVRADGIPLLPDRAAWETAIDLDIAPVIDASGTSLFFGFLFLGTTGGPGTVGTIHTCGDWTDPAASTTACLATWETTVGCNNSFSSCGPFRLLCLEN